MWAGVLIIGGCTASRYWCNVCNYNLTLYQPIVPQHFVPELYVITERPKSTPFCEETFRSEIT